MKILVIEDSLDNQQLATWILEDAGYEVTCADTAEQGLAYLTAPNPYRLVLMDISLPGMDGKQATQRIRADNQLADTVVIALTAHAVLDEVQSIIDSGVNEVLTKPLDENQLLDTITKYLGKP